ncbi:efflux RND transporter periplasmic adaptor subunit [Rhizobium sophoriradicis]|uniref:efflux RND transporter periplasmic adaptor subunit n=2 Tax=Rhizobium TaxID=379 RepID=UPI000F77E2BB|nr:efflux RND transporter periplasmic adaptor subunit [Rhizobium sophoriradicis]RSC15481.1 efflux RND transporter periplasmic adaptor subunit [Rhizobium sophoriradicis]
MFEVAISAGSAMLAGMNTTSEHDRTLAAQLRSLSIEPAAFETELPEPRAQRRMIHGAMFVLAATASLAVVALYGPRTLERIEAAIAGGAGDHPAISAHEVPARGGAIVEGMRPAADDGAKTRAAPSREVTGSGYVVAPDVATVFSKYEGRIVTVEVEAGDKVVAGQVLVRLDDAGARFALRGAEISERAAKLALDARNIARVQARSSLTRIGRLAGRDAMSAQALEEAKTTYDTAENGAEQARQDLAKARLDIDRAREQVEALTVRAPISGTVTRLDAHVGDTVLSREDSVRENESLLAITDTANMVIDADVAEANIALMRPGLSGEAVLDGFPGQPFAVEVAKIAPVISREKGTVTLRLSLTSPPSGMRPAMAARIRLVVGEESAGALHPTSSSGAPQGPRRTRAASAIATFHHQGAKQ